MPRLDLLVAKNTPYSRRDVARLFRAGKVRDVAGERLEPKVGITPSELPKDVVVDGEPIKLRCRYELLLNKPLGVVTAHADRRHPTAYALLRDAPLFDDLRAVGRLDKETSGLLMWTTDGSLLHRLTHPRYAVPRTYHAALARPFERPVEGFTLDDGHAPEIVELTEHPAEAMHPALARPIEAQTYASVTITTGRFHEVRRIFAALGSEVVALARVRFGSVELPHDLPLGEHRAFDLKATFLGLTPRS